MKKGIYGIIVMGLFLVSCGNHKQQRQKQRLSSVLTTKVSQRDVTTYTTYPTDIEGIINVDVRAKIAGYITKVLVDEGQAVKKGQLLFKLETHALNESAAASKANINAAQVKVDQLKPLVKKGIVSASQLATAKAQLAQAKSQYGTVNANIGYSEIRSPVNGVVGMIKLRKGNLVSPNSAQPLTTVSDISKVYAYFSMNESDYLDFMQKTKGKTRAEKIKNFPKITLVMANGEVYPHKGTIQTLNSQVDKQTGSISFRAVFPNKEQLLTNGSTGKIKIPKVFKNKIIVPQKSTYERQDKVFVVKVKKRGDSTFAQTDIINVVGKARNIYMVNGGLKPGEEIVAASPGKISDGTPIKVKNVPFDSIAKPLPVIFLK